MILCLINMDRVDQPVKKKPLYLYRVNYNISIPKKAQKPIFPWSPHLTETLFNDCKRVNPHSSGTLHRKPFYD